MFKSVMTEELRYAYGKQNENIQAIADALIGKRSIKINLDTVGPMYFTKGVDKHSISEKARYLVMRMQKASDQKLKLVKVEGNMCEVENLSTPKLEEWKPVDVEFIVE